MEDVAEAEEILNEFRDEMLDEIETIEHELGSYPRPTCNLFAVESI